MSGPENPFEGLWSIEMTAPGVFPIKIQFIKLCRWCLFMLMGYWIWTGRIVWWQILSLVNEAYLIWMYSINILILLTPLLLTPTTLNYFPSKCFTYINIQGTGELGHSFTVSICLKTKMQRTEHHQISKRWCNLNYQSI